MKLTTEMVPTATVELAPETQAALHASISQCAGIKEQIDLLESVLSAEKAVLMAILEEAGVSKAAQDGYHVAIVSGTTSTLDKNKLKALGVTEAMLQSATTIKPKKPYLSMRKAGERDAAGD